MTKNQGHGRYVESFGRLHLAQSLHDAGYVCTEHRRIFRDLEVHEGHRTRWGVY
jgi:hypothetical protein